MHTLKDRWLKNCSMNKLYSLLILLKHPLSVTLTFDPSAKSFTWYRVTPLKINTCLFSPELSWFTNAVSIKGIIEILNHLSKVGNKLKKCCRGKDNISMNNKSPIQFKRTEMTKPAPIGHQLPLTMPLRETFYIQWSFSTSAPTHVSQATLPLGLMPIRTLQRQWMNLSSSCHFG